ncbi:hypothetical protein PUN28_002274 [Cardiocondyla obscurior]|uniref:Uncharacterized protein n=1 Tax=Cardiocondyla obscurior TaxID=286306 RepID=A0AAW2GTH8_9HYME
MNIHRKEILPPRLNAILTKLIKGPLLRRPIIKFNLRLSAKSICEESKSRCIKFRNFQVTSAASWRAEFVNIFRNLRTGCLILHPLRKSESETQMRI